MYGDGPIRIPNMHFVSLLIYIHWGDDHSPILALYVRGETYGKSLLFLTLIIAHPSEEVARATQTDQTAAHHTVLLVVHFNCCADSTDRFPVGGLKWDCYES